MRKITTIKIIAILMSIWALADNPYGYYQILRWVIAGMAGYSAYLAYEQNKNNWLWTWIIMAILFNPIVPIHLDRETWSVLNIITAIIIFISICKKSIKKVIKVIKEISFTLIPTITTLIIIILLVLIFWVHHLNQQQEQQEKFEKWDKRFNDLDLPSPPPPPPLLIK